MSRLLYHTAKLLLTVTIYSTDPVTPEVRSVIDNFYDSVEFPQDLEHFGDIVMYVRRTALTTSMGIGS